MSEFERLLFRKHRKSLVPLWPMVGVMLALSLAAAVGGLYLGATERGAALWDEYFGPSLTWRKPIEPGRLDGDLASAVLSGRVTRVVDGDTIRLRLDTGQEFRVRLADIDAPESCQDYGDKATRLLANMVDGRKVRVLLVDADRYGRLVGRVYTDAIDVNAQMVGEGAAWFDSEFARDESLFFVEEEARDAGRGLWALPLEQRLEPHEFRQKFKCG